MKRDYILCKQRKATKGKIVIVILLFFSLMLFFDDTIQLVFKLIILFIVLAILATSVHYKIYTNFKNRKVYSVLGIPIFSLKLKILYPDYISVASGKFILNNDYSAVAALGTKERHQMYVLRFFNNNKHIKVYMSSSYIDVLDKARWLSAGLNKEIYDATKN